MTQRPRVAHFAIAPEFVDKIMLHDLRRLREHEDVTVIATEGTALERVRREGFKVLTISAHRKLSPFLDLRTIWQLLRLFRHHRFDLLHTYTPKAGLLGQIAGFMSGIPHRIHGCRGLLYTETMPGWQRRVFSATDRITSRLADITLFLSEADRRHAIDQGLCPPERAVLVGTGVDLAEFVPDRATREAGMALRQGLGFESRHTVVLTVGRYVADKGYRETSVAAARLRERFPDIRYLWVAPVLDGEEGVLSSALAEENGIADIVRILGYTEDMRPPLGAANVLLHPSYREGVPRVVVEAAVMGIPIVASDIPGCREVVHDGETGILFPPRDAEALERALEGVFSDLPGAARRAERAVADVRSRFDQDALSRRVWSAHARLLGASADVASH